MKDIFDGVRVVTMIRDKPIPRNLDVDGFHVKVSYYGQSVECDICNNHGHVARDCPLKGVGYKTSYAFLFGFVFCPRSAGEELHHFYIFVLLWYVPCARSIRQINSFSL